MDKLTVKDKNKIKDEFTHFLLPYYYPTHHYLTPTPKLMIMEQDITSQST